MPLERCGVARPRASTRAPVARLCVPPLSSYTAAPLTLPRCYAFTEYDTHAQHLITVLHDHGPVTVRRDCISSSASEHASEHASEQAFRRPRAPRLRAARRARARVGRIDATQAEGDLGQLRMRPDTGYTYTVGAGAGGMCARGVGTATSQSLGSREIRHL